ncbi:MAG: AIR synthase family protein [Candidatus Bathyarchaeia archaeon]
MPKRLQLGKLSPETLQRVIYTRLGVRDPRVLVGPKIGEDAAVIDMGPKVLVVHSDPISGATENLGWLAVNVAANDVATRGAKPRWCSLVLFLPEDASLDLLETVMNQVDEAAIAIQASVVSGHTEVTPGLRRPIAACTCMGEAPRDRFITTSGARRGDAIIMTKGAAIEGTAILAAEFTDRLEPLIGKPTVEAAKRFVRKVSVVRDALTAVEAGGVTAMHDATEGGLLGGLYEMAYASRLGIRASCEKVLVAPETKAVCEAVGVDPLRTISSGTLLIAAKGEKADEVIYALRQADVEASNIGSFVDRTEGVKMTMPDGSVVDVSTPVQDELWRLISRSEWA